MPELPDIVNYVDALRERTAGSLLERITVHHPFLLRTVTPSPADCAGRTVREVRRAGKQIVVELDGRLFVAIHLMVAGRLAWSPQEGEQGAKAGLRRRKGLLGEIAFRGGTLSLTEAGSQRRAALRILEGADALSVLDRGGLELLECSTAELATGLRRENRTLKRALTDPRLVSGVGNAYSDEILHAARLSPFARTSTLPDEAIARLHAAARTTLLAWTDRLRTERNGAFPRKVTAFHPQMAVHGKFGRPCPACGTAVQRVRYAENEANYCPRCQTDGKVHADRALSRLLKDDWPRSIEELERFKDRGTARG